MHRKNLSLVAVLCVGLLAAGCAKPPQQEQEAMRRRNIMRRARSKKHRPILLAELERRYLDAP